MEHQNQIQEDESMEENIFSVLTRPETRNNHLKFWEVYSFIDEMLEQCTHRTHVLSEHLFDSIFYPL